MDMKCLTLYRSVMCSLAVWLLIAGCTNEVPDGTDPPANERMTRIAFSSSAFTKGDTGSGDLPADEETTKIETIDLYAFAWGEADKNGNRQNLNFIHEQVTGTDTVEVSSDFFEMDKWSQKIAYTNMYAIANQGQVVLKQNIGGSYNNFGAYVYALEQIVGRNKPLGAEYEDMFRDILVRMTQQNGHVDKPVLVKTLTLEGGASYISMSLERIYCRIYFSFLLAGNTTDEITIKKITVDKNNNVGYLFKEENVSGQSLASDLQWTLPDSGNLFRDAAGSAYSQPLRPGFPMLTAYLDDYPYNFLSYQYLCDDLSVAPCIELTIGVKNTEGASPVERTLRAPLYNTDGTGNKKHYGLMRNHSYHVISTINSNTLELKAVTVDAQDWVERPPVSIPDFE